MWKFGRNIVFSRWNVKRQAVDNKNCANSNILANSCQKKNEYSERQEYEEGKSHQDKKFRQQDQFHFLLSRSRLCETAGWLGTVSVLCFNLHYRHLSLFSHEGPRSRCVFSRSVLAMPQVSIANKKKLLESFDSYSSQQSVPLKETKPKIALSKQSLESLKMDSEKYKASFQNSAGLSCLKKNDKEAFHYFQNAARLGSSQGYYNLGLCYELGKGTKVNLSRASFCYRRAAMKGHGLASFNLAVYFLKGLGGLPVDRQAAKLLLETAAEQDIPEAKMFVALEYLEEEKWSDAFEIFKYLAQKDFVEGKYYLSLCYENGWGTEKNGKLATEILSETATLGHAKSILTLSRYYEEGLGGCTPDFEFALALCHILADQGNEEAHDAILRLQTKKDNLSKSQALLPKSVPILKDRQSNMHTSTSVPEFKKEEAPRNFLYGSIISAYLGLITPSQTELAAEAKTTFFIGDENVKFNYVNYIPTLQTAVTATI